jgi:hypothetical protein
MADPPPDPRQVELDLRKGEEEIRKLKAETRSAEVASITPTLPTEVAGGVLDAGDNASPIGVINSYRSLQSAAGQIAQAVPQDTTCVWIAQTDVVTKYRAVHDATRWSLERLQSDLTQVESMLKPTDPNAKFLPAVPLIALVSLASSAFSLLTSALSTNTTVRSKDVTISFFAAAASVAAQVKVHRPQTTRILMEGMPLPTATGLDTTLRELEAKYDAVRQLLAAYKARHVDEPPSTVAMTSERLEAWRLFVAETVKLQDADKMTAAVAQLDTAATNAADACMAHAQHVSIANTATQVLDDVGAVLKALRQPDASGNTAVQMADTFEAVSGASILLLESSYAGAESVYEELKGRKDRGTHTGSSVLSYVMLKPDFSIVASGSVSGVMIATNKTGEKGVSWT